MNKRQNYIISRNHEELATIPARSCEEAAKIWARRESGRKATAYRTTGDFGKSGYFQAFEPVGTEKTSGYATINEMFHVWG